MRTEARSSLRSDAQRVVVAQAVSNRGEVGVVRAHDDGDCELGRLEGIVATRGNEAAADKRNRGQRVNRSEFADGVEQNDLAGPERASCRAASRRLSRPVGTPGPKSAGFIKKRGDGAETLGMARREDEDKPRIGGNEPWPCLNERGFFALKRAAGNDESQTGGHRL